MPSAWPPCLLCCLGGVKSTEGDVKPLKRARVAQCLIANVLPDNPSFVTPLPSPEATWGLKLCVCSCSWENTCNSQASLFLLFGVLLPVLAWCWSTQRSPKQRDFLIHKISCLAHDNFLPLASSFLINLPGYYIHQGLFRWSFKCASCL